MTTRPTATTQLPSALGLSLSPALSPNALAHPPRRLGSRAAAVRCGGGVGVCPAPGNRPILGTDYHSPDDGTGCESLEPAANEPAPRQRKWDGHVNEGAKP